MRIDTAIWCQVRPRSHLAVFALWLCLSLVLLGSYEGTQAQEQPAAAEREAARRVVLRFLTTSDFPPFNFYDEDGVLTGFNVDLARAICLDLDVTCEIKVEPWENLLPSLLRKEGDAVIASQMVTAQALTNYDFTDRYFHTPGRFAGRRDATGLEATPEALSGRKVGVAQGTTHEAFIRQFFRGSQIVTFKDADAAREALKKGDVNAIFGDAISLSFWLNGTASNQCCEFKGEAFLEPKFFGDGVAIAVAKGDRQLKAELDDALKQVRSSGRFVELVTRYFPFRIY
ncbi:ABC transporter substrate-binding protein [Candidatus Filomicrobium marinum]|uniref:ABC transporter substrate-binding protein n=2 Tax=Filomicrobium TaxID=119044 RepID=A0A0D6JEC2_9HYPH|nr:MULTISPECIES: transporter substrate-binding domain-containing protein [Filomicrobium]MCV0367838.1 transporter substrate-binding domain-containing protein [Filomicrobium sp.]CFX19904.1 ABC transporter substrate-binding protein [Candidatus Filomicrobium marinum]CPR18574.1 ABC transporter substrate-binding protein [Candidatus Filomicrobium marinum]SDO16938.1 polar amino acid transport system substrate-binding protein [Filomicrobium insigne]